MKAVATLRKQLNNDSKITNYTKLFTIPNTLWSQSGHYTGVLPSYGSYSCCGR